ncbi:hypothetical protein [Pseudidiomarina salilacus]|uniref:hypothetical protein n=1 Tax=Pseudidiomarina salilacus TaxID=3384452 RepID=UPI003984D608
MLSYTLMVTEYLTLIIVMSLTVNDLNPQHNKSTSNVEEISVPSLIRVILSY